MATGMGQERHDSQTRTAYNVEVVEWQDTTERSRYGALVASPIVQNVVVNTRPSRHAREIAYIYAAKLVVAPPTGQIRKRPSASAGCAIPLGSTVEQRRRRGRACRLLTQASLLNTDAGNGWSLTPKEQLRSWPELSTGLTGFGAHPPQPANGRPLRTAACPCAAKKDTEK